MRKRERHVLFGRKRRSRPKKSARRDGEKQPPSTGRSFAVFHKGEAEASAGAGKENGDAGEGGLCRTEKPCGKAEKRRRMHDMDAAWRRRTRKKTQCPCRWAECVDAACASWKKASEQSDAAGKMRREARGIALGEKMRVPSALRRSCGICCIQNEQKRKSGRDFRFVISASAHADGIRLLICLGCKDTDAYNNKNKTGENGEYQSSEFHSILLEEMKECPNVVALTISYSDDCPYIRMKSSMFFLEHNRGVC